MDTIFSNIEDFFVRWLEGNPLHFIIFVGIIGVVSIIANAIPIGRRRNHTDLEE